MRRLLLSVRIGFLCWIALTTGVVVVPSRCVAETERQTPALVGVERGEAAAWLEEIGVKAEWRSAGTASVAGQEGRVAAQAPPAGTPLAAQAPVMVWVYDAGAVTGGAASAAAHGVPGARPMGPDCSRWPGSVADAEHGSCRCPEGQWWKLDGDGCLSPEAAAAEFCPRIWAGSRPLWSATGDFRCDCPAELLWDAESASCVTPASEAAVDCNERWPGTRPIFSPAAVAYECRCGRGSRWEEDLHRCVDAATAVSGAGAPAPTGGLTPPAAEPQASEPAPAEPVPAAPRPQADPSGNSACAELIEEIRGRARAGQGPQADAVALSAATKGCDPAAISEAVRGAGPAAGAPAPPAATPQPPAAATPRPSPAGTRY